MAGRLFAIGDIHGCNVALQTLLSAINLEQDDTIVTLGDYVDRGPDSRGVIDSLLALRKKCNLITLLGNHEQMMLESRTDTEMHSSWLGFGGVEALESYGPGATLADVPSEHWDFIESCVEFCETERFAFLHASYQDNVPFDQMGMYTLRWKPLEVDAFLRPHISGKTIVVGHTPQRNGRILDLGFLIDIDTNCCRGGWLTALDVLGMKFWQSSEKGQSRCGQLRS